MHTTLTAACFLALAGLIAPDVSAARGFTVLYDFQGPGSGDGGYPLGKPLLDAAGNIYGVAGGGNIQACPRYGCGIVYELAADGTEKTLHSFDGTDGYGPSGGVIMDRHGSLYGVTLGAYNASCGLVFRLAPDGTETTLYSFEDSHGCYPSGGLLMYNNDLYGTAFYGGGGTNNCGGGCGVVFKLAPDGTQTVLYAFAGGSDGEGPEGDLIMDAAHNIYGTTFYGGNYGCGVAYKLDPHGMETVLHAFSGGSDGCGPEGGLTMDAAGNIYGATSTGGGSGGSGYGVVFKIASDGTETVLYRFGGGSDGASPGGLLLSKTGDLFGTTESGGGCCGTVFKLAPDDTLTVLHKFARADGKRAGDLVPGKNGTLYGTALTGGGTAGCKRMGAGKGCGTVFVLQK